MASQDNLLTLSIKAKIMSIEKDILCQSLQLLEKKHQQLDRDYDQLNQQVSVYTDDDNFVFNDFEPKLHQIGSKSSYLLRKIGQFNSIADNLLERCDKSEKNLLHKKEKLLDQFYTIMDNGKLNKYKANEFWLNNKEDFELVFKQKLQEIQQETQFYKFNCSLNNMDHDGIEP